MDSNHISVGDTVKIVGPAGDGGDLSLFGKVLTVVAVHMQVVEVMDDNVPKWFRYANVQKQMP